MINVLGFTYDPESGVVRRPNGRSLGTLHSSGYLFAKVDGQVIRVHRLAWFLATGTWPVGEVDHINGIRADNRLENLRDVPKRENAQNLRGAKRSSGTGVLGVSWDKERGKFKAQIVANGKSRCLGRFDDIDAAHAVYLDAKRRLHEGCTL